MASNVFLLISILFTISDSLSAKANVIELNEDNWKQILEDEWMVEFFAPWCPACKSLTPVWNSFAEWSKDLDIKVGQVDVTTSPGLSGRFMVTALPTIFHVIKGEFRQYRGSRDKNAFISFIEDKKWKEVEPISSWKSPNSIQMSILSSFFKLSQLLRSVHNQLMVEYGLPSWGSYLIFAFATIILGAILGLILVCILDFVYPPKTIYKEKKEDKLEKENQKVKLEEELADEDIKDDLLDDGNIDIDNEKNSESDSSQVMSTTPSEDNQKTNVRKRKPRLAD